MFLSYNPNPLWLSVAPCGGFPWLPNWIWHSQSVSWVKATADILITLTSFSRDLALNVY